MAPSSVTITEIEDDIMPAPAAPVGPANKPKKGKTPNTVVEVRRSLRLAMLNSGFKGKAPETEKVKETPEEPTAKPAKKKKKSVLPTWALYLKHNSLMTKHLHQLICLFQLCKHLVLAHVRCVLVMYLKKH